MSMLRYCRRHDITPRPWQREFPNIESGVIYIKTPTSARAKTQGGVPRRICIIRKYRYYQEE